MTPIHYATYFDRHYLPRGVALYQSLIRHSPPFVLWVLCLDTEVKRALVRLGLEHVRLVPLGDLEQADPALPTVKSERLPVEYYWTCGPAFLLHVLQRDPRIDMVTYVDADLFFYSDLTPLYEELGANAILLVEHRRGPHEPDDRRRTGIYNVGLLVFRSTGSGLACLRRWREQCLDWCFDIYEGDRFGDQAYLDDWPAQFPDVTVTQHNGAGLAPWNVLDARVEFENGQVLVGGSPLVFYHFGRLRRITSWLYEMHDWRFHRRTVTRVVRQRVYGPYLRELAAAERRIRGVGERIHPGTVGRRPSNEMIRRRLESHGRRFSKARCQRFVIVAGPRVF